MMTTEAKDIVNAYRKAGHIVSDKECQKVYDLCKKKMANCKAEDKDGYMALLFADELKNYLIRRFINAASKEYMDCRARTREA